MRPEFGIGLGHHLYEPMAPAGDTVAALPLLVTRMMVWIQAFGTPNRRDTSTTAAAAADARRPRGRDWGNACEEIATNSLADRKACKEAKRCGINLALPGSTRASRGPRLSGPRAAHTIGHRTNPSFRNSVNCSQPCPPRQESTTDHCILVVRRFARHGSPWHHDAI